ncbi:MAG: hypothetical protein ABF293_05875 [Flavobacteriaceae bacterium]
MKQFLHKVSAILMSAIVLFSTLSFTVDMHYCGNTLVDVALFTEASNCGMGQMQPEEDCGIKMEKNSCCTDQQFVMEGQDDLKDNALKLSFEQQTFLVSYVCTYFSLFESDITSYASLLGQPPPLLDKNFQVLFQTFLI